MTARNQDHKWFQFKKDPFSQPTRIVWRVDDEITVIPQDIAAFMIRMRYARNVLQEEADRWNALVEEYAAQNTVDAGGTQEPPQEPASTQTATAATTTVEGGETAQEALDNGANGTVASEAATTAQQLAAETPADEKPAEEQASESGQASEQYSEPDQEADQKPADQTETEDEPAAKKGKSSKSKGLL